MGYGPIEKEAAKTPRVAAVPGPLAAAQLKLHGAAPGALMTDVVHLTEPHNVKLVITDEDASITDFSVTVTGEDPQGGIITETFAFAGGLTQTGEKLFGVIVCVTVTALAGGEEGDTLDLVYGDMKAEPETPSASGQQDRQAPDQVQVQHEAAPDPSAQARPEDEAVAQQEETTARVDEPHTKRGRGGRHH